MSKIVQQLQSAAELEKKAYFDYIKTYSSSGITALVKGGVTLEKAASMIKEVCQKDAKASSLKTNSQIFEKAAEYITDLEDQISKLEKFAKEVEKEKAIEESTPLNKLASIGFTKEELAYMSSLPENLVEKVAGISSQPWEMGGGVGMSRPKTDPLLEFLLN